MKKLFLFWTVMGLIGIHNDSAEEIKDIKDSVRLGEIIITGTRSAVNRNLLPMIVSVVGLQQLAGRYTSSVLTTCKWVIYCYR